MKNLFLSLALVCLTISLTSSTICNNTTSVDVEVVSGWTVGAAVTATYIGSDGNGDEDYVTSVTMCITNAAGTHIKVRLADGTIGAMPTGSTSLPIGRPHLSHWHTRKQPLHRGELMYLVQPLVTPRVALQGRQRCRDYLLR